MIQIKAEPRTIVGKRVRILRRQKLVPASINFTHEPTLLIQISDKNVNKLLGHQEVQVIEVDIAGKKHTVVVEDILISPLTNKVMTVNLSRITKDYYVKVDLPIRAVGISPAVKNNIGLLVYVHKNIRVRVRLDTYIPFFEIDVSGLEEVAQTIKITDIDLPEGIIIDKTKDKDITLLSIAPPQKAVVIETDEDADVEGEGEEAVEGEGEGGEGDKESTEGEVTEKSKD